MEIHGKYVCIFIIPSEEYMRYLAEMDVLDIRGCISCRDLFPGENNREKILIFSIGQSK